MSTTGRGFLLYKVVDKNLQRKIIFSALLDKLMTNIGLRNEDNIKAGF